jgi:uncharacterized membrane protein
MRTFLARNTSSFDNMKYINEGILSGGSSLIIRIFSRFNEMTLINVTYNVKLFIFFYGLILPSLHVTILFRKYRKETGIIDSLKL